ncbi:unnamed protein product [Agarophyton chilense]
MTSSFYFGPWRCAWSEAFYLSPLSLAMVNTKPVVPGHCLIVTRRVVPRVADLTSEELADLWKVACHISKPLERFFEAEALTFTLQDGPVAGQTVPHVHIHILPRRIGDFEINNQVYREIEKTDLSRTVRVDAEEHRKARTLDEMAKEARTLRTLFTDSLPIPTE